MGRGLRFIQVLGVNSVPALGVFVNDWTASTALTLYWCENVLVTLLVGLRIWMHRRKTGKRGHWEAEVGSGKLTKARRGTFLSVFLTVALIFSAAHGVFLALILFLAIPEKFPDAGGIDPASLMRGLAVISIFLALGLVYDLIGLEKRRFFWIKKLADRLLGRVIVVHVTIIFGMWAMFGFEAPMGLFVVFAIFKTLSDLSAMTGGGTETGDSFAGYIREQAEQRRETVWEESRTP